MREPEPDPSASTAQFRAFASERSGADSQPWQMRAPRNKVLMLSAATIAIAIILALVAFAFIG
ncbi:MAG TPA: hypothetical protein VG253_22425 [Streptosporangiaceae bacterium]|jgi:hypothetical protein|nr:hypothetical protein [Streptosporangiaceae bacterium]